MEKVNWLIIGAFVVPALIVLLPIAIISQRNLKKNLKKNKKFREEYKAGTIKGAFYFMIPLGVYLLLLSFVNITGIGFEFDSPIVMYFPELEIFHTVLILLLGVFILVYSYRETKNLLTWKEALIILLAWFSMFFIELYRIFN
jgi:hypothetical protein